MNMNNEQNNNQNQGAVANMSNITPQPTTNINSAPQNPVNQPVAQPNTVPTNATQQVTTNINSAPQSPISQPVAQPNTTQQAATPVTPSAVVEEPTPVVLEDNITFDYNALYGIDQNSNNEVQQQQEEDNKPIFTTEDIVFDNNSLSESINNDVVPEFNLNHLDNTQTEDGKAEQVLSNKQADKADTRRRIIYLAAIFLIIVICLLVIFPKMAGYSK